MLEKDKILLQSHLQNEIYNWLKSYQSLYGRKFNFKFDKNIHLGKINYILNDIKTMPKKSSLYLERSEIPHDIKIEKSVNSDIAEKTTIDFDDGRNEEIQQLREKVQNCTLCTLSQTRTNVVFGEGSINSRIMIVGEAPGAEEDKTGIPFVGKSGQLLNKMLLAIGISRDDVFISNVLKCRPPQNRDPQPNEIQSCAQYLTKQLEIINPKVILALGRYAAIRLLNVTDSMGNFRKKIHSYNEIPLIVTYHPSALLRNEKWKYPAWEDLKKLKKMFLD